MPPIKSRTSGSRLFLNDSSSSKPSWTKVRPTRRYKLGTSRTTTVSSGSKGCVKDETKTSCEIYEAIQDEEEEMNNTPNKYRLIKISEKKFSGMIWDVGFTRTGSVYVCFGVGVALCNTELNTQLQLDVNLPGGATSLPDGKLVIVDRFSDGIEVYSPDGLLALSFPGGSSPMSVAADFARERILVTDVRDKCVHVFDTVGKLKMDIASSGIGYTLQWPLYIIVLDSGAVIVSDIMQKALIQFDAEGTYSQTLMLRTCDGRHAVHPHGLSVFPGNEKYIVVVDSSNDSIEVFDCSDGNCCHVQTLLESRDGYKPRVVGVGTDGCLVVGSLTGLVRIYRIVDNCVEFESATAGLVQEISTSSKAVDCKFNFDLNKHPTKSCFVECVKIAEDHENKSRSTRKVRFENICHESHNGCVGNMDLSQRITNLNDNNDCLLIVGDDVTNSDAARNEVTYIDSDSDEEPACVKTNCDESGQVVDELNTSNVSKRCNNSDSYCSSDKHVTQVVDQRYSEDEVTEVDDCDMNENVEQLVTELIDDDNYCEGASAELNCTVQDDHDDCVIVLD